MRAAKKPDEHPHDSQKENVKTPAKTCVDTRILDKPAANSSQNGTSRKKPTIDKRDLLIERQALVIRTLAEFVDQDSLMGSLTALTVELQHRFRSDRVVIGLVRNDSMEIRAISQQAEIDPLSGEVKLLADAMQEACEQDQIIHFPTEDHNLLITVAHQALTVGRQSAQICTIPLCHQGQLVGALLFDIDSTQKWSQLTIELMRQVAELITPLALIRQKAEYGITKLAGERIRSLVTVIFKPNHLAAKCIITLLILSVLAAASIPTTYDVTTTVEIVPVERRIITAPRRGYIKQVKSGAGDEIESNQLLLTLDTRELELERINRENDLRISRSELRAAMAAYNRKDIALANARLAQAQAKLDLVLQKINRSYLYAPSNGTIVSGDYSQSLGAPVERGDKLFEIAPTGDYKAFLMVPESRISFIRVGQPGSITLKSEPGKEIPISVDKIHPMAEVASGSNRFRVEVSFKQQPPNLGLGQTGIGKLRAHQTNFLWVYTHKFTDWLKLQLWKWFG